jgi:hypothetical protein
VTLREPHRDDRLSFWALLDRLFVHDCLSGKLRDVTESVIVR